MDYFLDPPRGLGEDYTLNQNQKPYMGQGLFLDEGLLEALGTNHVKTRNYP